MDNYHRMRLIALLTLLAFPISGGASEDVLEVTGLVISVSFSDTPDELKHPLSAIWDLLNDPNYRDNPTNRAQNNGSLWSYFHEVSHGRFSLKHAVAAYRAPQPATYYLHKSKRAKRVKELLDLALLDLRDEQAFDFSDITLNEAGEIVALALFYMSQAEPRTDDFIPGYAAASAQDYGSFKSRRFHIVPQRNFYQLPDGSRPLVLRTFAHESAHAVLGWPDLYDIDGSSKGLGMASLMSGTGDYPNPLLPCAYLRAREGWIPVIDITHDAPGTLREVTGDGEIAYRYRHPTDANEYFLIDALHKASRADGRFSTTKNSNVPPQGLRIWHVDERGVNSQEA
ncbi:MAG: hypothetical protein MI702_12015, partial [Chlorobiales bacterium]|nr:hypothetical protein [Chlorobiales bacterium]